MAAAAVMMPEMLAPHRALTSRKSWQCTTIKLMKVTTWLM